MHQLERRDLDNAMARLRVKAGGLRVDYDFPHAALPRKRCNRALRCHSLSHAADDRRKLPRRGRAAQRRADDKIGTAALLAIRELRIEDRGEARSAHPRPAHHPLPLQSRRRGDDDDAVDPVDPIGLEQQRDIEHHKRRVACPLARDPAALHGTYHRVEDFFPAGAIPPPACRTHAVRAWRRSIAPVSPRTPGNAASTAVTAFPPGPSILWISASAS